MSKKRQRTVWYSKAFYQDGSFIRAGRIYHHNGYPADVIRLQINGNNPEASVDICCTVDEALAITSCLGGVLAHEMLPKANKLRRMFR